MRIVGPLLVGLCLGLAGAAVSSCTPSGCHSSNCHGCCDATGVCRSGFDSNACGVAGNNCLFCGNGLFCNQGACAEQSGVGGGTGGTGGTGGNTSTGGGVGTGGGSAGGTGGGGSAGGTGGGSAVITCGPCTTTNDCTSGASCAQYAGSDYCAKSCTGPGDCGADEACTLTSATDGTQINVCVPSNGTCGSSGCGTCPSGTTCDPIQGACLSNGTGGGGGGGGSGSDGGTCGFYDLPGTSSCCHSCIQGGTGCQLNGCISGWWCDTTTCLCHAPVNMVCANSDAGFVTYDGGINASGGSVSKLYFAVVGDTRPAIENDTAHYPTSVITTIYQDLAALNPPPQFVITTGDYMFASTTSTASTDQIALYMGARNLFPNIVFSAMGNHECTGAAATNCSGMTTNNYSAFMSNLVIPLGHTTPYYSVPISDTNGQWTAKIIVTACNYWNTTQKSWLATELAGSATYKFVVRHHPIGSNGPCNSDMDTMLASASYTGLFTGHTHSVYFSTNTKQLVEGVGGAPVTGSSTYGYALVEQQSAGGFKITQYDSATNSALHIYTLP